MGSTIKWWKHCAPVTCRFPGNPAKDYRFHEFGMQCRSEGVSSPGSQWHPAMILYYLTRKQMAVNEGYYLDSMCYYAFYVNAHTLGDVGDWLACEVMALAVLGAATHAQNTCPTSTFSVNRVLSVAMLLIRRLLSLCNSPVLNMSAEYRRLHLHSTGLKNSTTSKGSASQKEFNLFSSQPSQSKFKVGFWTAFKPAFKTESII